MFRKNRQQNSELDAAGGMGLGAAGAKDTETEAAADAPFLFARVRARIGEEMRRREEAGGLQSLLVVAWRALPVMAVVALLAVVLTLWTAQPNAPASGFGIFEEA